MTDFMFLIVVIIFVFISGFGWGEMYAERVIRKQQYGINKGRISVSIPASEKDAAGLLRLLGDLVEHVEEKEQR